WMGRPKGRPPWAPSTAAVSSKRWPAAAELFFQAIRSPAPLLAGALHRRQALDHRHDHARVLLAEARRQGRLLIALRHVREADGDVQLLADRVERIQILVHQRDLEARLEVARDERGRDALERLAAAAAGLDYLVDRHRIEAPLPPP